MYEEIVSECVVSESEVQRRFFHHLIRFGHENRHPDVLQYGHEAKLIAAAEAGEKKHKWVEQDRTGEPSHDVVRGKPGQQNIHVSGDTTGMDVSVPRDCLFISEFRLGFELCLYLLQLFLSENKLGPEREFSLNRHVRLRAPLQSWNVLFKCLASITFFLFDIDAAD